MNSKKIYLISTLLLLSIFISACTSSVYASTSWHGLTADANYAYLAAGSQVYAVDLNTGSQKWKYPDKPNAKGFYANPVLTPDGGQLLIPSYDHMLYSLDPNTGLQNKWATPPNLKNRLIASPLVIGNNIYQPSSDGNLYIIDLATGKINKTIPIGKTPLGPLWAQPVEGLNCQCIYIASMDHKVYSINLTTGELLPSQDLGGSIVGKPAVGPDGTVYVGTFSSDLVALDGMTLRTKWPQPFHTQDWVWAGPALENNILYFGDLSGNFYSVNASDGTPVWAPIKPNNTIVDTPVISGDKLYVTTEADSLYTISTAGAIVNTTIVGGVIYSTPLIAGDKILVAPTGFGTTLLVALSLENPNAAQKWAFIPAK
jgi:outer membrane protein assembly factor BamB